MKRLTFEPVLDMFTSTLLAVSVCLQSISAIPLIPRDLFERNNGTSTRSSAWVASPPGRGTYDLLLSCATTLSLCAWTAVHLNVPGTKSGFRRTLHRLGWMLLAIVFPEQVLEAAFNQWYVAKDLMDEINKLGVQAVNGARGVRILRHSESIHLQHSSVHLCATMRTVPVMGT